MGYWNWANRKVKELDAFDMACTKLSIFAFTLVIAHFFPEVLGVSWKVYAAVFAVAAARPVYRIFSSKKAA